MSIFGKLRQSACFLPLTPLFAIDCLRMTELRGCKGGLYAIGGIGGADSEEMRGFGTLKAAFIERLVSQFGQESRFSVPASFQSAIGRAAVKAGREATAQAARNAELRAVSPMAC